MSTPPFAARYEVLPGNGLMDRLQAARRFGFDAVSFPGRYLSTFEPQLRSHAHEAPIAMGCLSLGFEGSLVSPDAGVRTKCRNSLRRLLELCREVGLIGVNITPVLIQDNPVRYPWKPGDDDAARAQDAHLLDELPALCAVAHDLGLLLLLEPVNRYESEYLHTLGHAASLCRRIGRESLGVTCDFYHMQLEELDAAGAIRAAGRWIRHVHVAENTRVEPGPGALDFTPGFRALKDIGYAGMIEVECRSLSGPPEDVYPRSLEYLRQTWDRA